MKKKSTITLLIIILILVATAGISFAAFSYAKNGTNENSVKIGDLTFKYTENNSKGNGIDIKDAFPVTDQEGKELTDYFDFKIESNLSKSDLLYEVVIEPTNESTINLNGVKVYITEVVNGTEKDISSNYNNQNKVKVINDYSNGIIYQERILKNTSDYEKNFRVRIWISDDIDWSDEGYIGEKGSFRINVNARTNQSMVDASIPTPVITGGTGDTWVTSSPTIKVVESTPYIGGIDHYEYYKTTNELDIPNEDTVATGTVPTSTPQIVVDDANTTYIYFRTVTTNGTKSEWSTSQRVNRQFLLNSKILADNQLKTNPTLTGPSTNCVNNSTTGLTECTEVDEGGLYKMSVANGFGGTDGDSYYFRGIVNNNYVAFAEKTWRIVRINEDGTIRLILDTSVDNDDHIFNNQSKGYTQMYYSNSESIGDNASPNAKYSIDAWYNSNIGNNNNYTSKVATGNYFCETAKVVTNTMFNTAEGTTFMVPYTEYTPNLKCLEDGNHKQYTSGPDGKAVGMLTYDEAVLAGDYPNKKNKTNYLYTSQNGNNNFQWWLMSPLGILSKNAFIGAIGTDGMLTGFNTTSVKRLRPVIVLKADTIVKVDPTTGYYVVQ